MMSSARYILLILIGISLQENINPLITNQKICPKLPIISLQSTPCNINVISWELEALANIPGDGHSINPFHNPYGPHFSCSYFLFFCREDQLAFGDLYLTSKIFPNMVCPGLQFTRLDHVWGIHIDHNPHAMDCARVERWNTVELFVYQQNQSIFMYSCKDHEKDKNVEVGAWILAFRNGSDEMKRNVLDLGMKFFDQIPGIKRDWWKYPNNSVDCMASFNCSYFADCVIDNEEEYVIEDYSEAVAADYSYALIIPIVFSAVVILLIKVFNLQKNRYQSRVVPINN